MIFFLAKSLVILLLPSLGWSAPAKEPDSIVSQQQAEFVAESCLEFFALNFQVLNFERYETYFDDTSILSVAQTGDYKGVENILEYVLFVDETSPHISERMDTETLFQGSIEPDGEISQTLPFKFDSVNGICTFTAIEKAGVVLDPALTCGGSLMYAYLVNLSYSIERGKIVRFDTYFTESWLLEYFGRLQTPGVASLICDVLTSNTCLDVLGDGYQDPELTHATCVDGLAELPLAESGAYIDGNTFGCRALHSVFAQNNPLHCAHLALQPTEDTNGKIKCNESAGRDPLDLFSQGEIDRLFQTCADDPDLDGDTCFTILAEAPTTKQAKTCKTNKKSKKSKKAK